jgi:ubiquinone/menaquinone biosynthesis C-methylase UbiE
MKVEDSGMPEECYWNSLFNIEGIVDWLAIPKSSTIVEVGCGYGTFTAPIARHHNGEIVAFDIEPFMIEITKRNVSKSGASNVTCILRDILEEGTGLKPESVDVVLLFNILHFSERRKLLSEAARILKNGGFVAIIHWRKDIPTPRGPIIELRPDMDQILNASEGLALHTRGTEKVLEPYHWGIQLIKGAAS